MNPIKEPANTEDNHSELQPALINAKELAKFLNVTTKTVRSYVKSRYLPYLRINGRIYFERQRVLESLRKRFEVKPR